MDLDNVAEDDLNTLNAMGFSPQWNAYALSYFHGARDQAVQFMAEHNERLEKIATQSNKVSGARQTLSECMCRRQHAGWSWHALSVWCGCVIMCECGVVCVCLVLLNVCTYNPSNQTR